MSSTKNSEYVCNHVKKRKQDLVSVLGGKCCICGFDKYIEALEFHHFYPEQKEFGIASSNTITKALDKQLEELKKCILVCSNCHKGIHGGYITPSKELLNLYDTKKADFLLEENYNTKHGQQKYCQRCGKAINKNSTYCKECYDIIQRKVDRPDRDTLKDLIYKKPFTHIAKQFSVTDNTIRKWCKSYNLPFKKTEINKYSEEEWQKI